MTASVAVMLSRPQVEVRNVFFEGKFDKIATYWGTDGTQSVGLISGIISFTNSFFENAVCQPT